MRTHVLLLLSAFACNTGKPPSEVVLGDALGEDTTVDTEVEPEPTPTATPTPVDTAGDSSPSSSCGTDPHEPNDNRTLATVTGITAPGDAFDADDVELDATIDDVDVYTMLVPGDCTLHIDVGFTHTDGNIDLELRDASSVLEAATSEDDDEAIRWRSEIVDREVFLGVASTDSTCTVYDIDLSLDCGGGSAPPPVCGADPFEPNGTHRTAAQTSLNSDGDSFVEVLVEMNGTASLLDEIDYYQTSVPVGCGLDAKALFDHGAGDIELFVEDGAGLRLGTSTSTTNDEQVVWYNDRSAPVDAFVRVEAATPTCSRYTIDLAISCAPPPTPVPSP